MNRATAVTLLVLASLFLGVINVPPVFSADTQTIYIKPDGSIDPSSAPIHMSNHVYTLTEDTTSQLIIEANNIVLDGAGFEFLGNQESGVAINMTCSNVTVENAVMTNWQAAVLGVFDNNTVKNCVITQCESGLKIYARRYVILTNDFENNSEGIRIGQGGLHLIAQNTFVNNGAGISLYDSGNIIIDNSFINCSAQAIYQDAKGWSQTVYHNNFINNTEDLMDESNGVDRPMQAALPPWDNGSTGNYWSNYPGCDLNRDGIGDTAYAIPPNRLVNIPHSYDFVDRYPLINPVNINQADFEIPTTAPTNFAPLNSTASDQATALSFLKEVFGLDLTRYTITLGDGSLRESPKGLSTDYMDWGLWHWDTGLTTANASTVVNNGVVTFASVESTGGQLFSTFQLSNSFDTALKIMQNYQTYTKDPDVTKMITLLNGAGSEKNYSSQLGNLDFKISVFSMYTTFTWNYIYSGVDYTGVTLSLSNYLGYMPSFTDNRSLYGVDSSDINLSEQEAVQIAENYVGNYSYPVNSGNGTINSVENLIISKTGPTANLTSTTHESNTLLPCWAVEVPLDHVYPQKTESLTVYLWAGNGTVFDAERNIVPPPNPYSAPTISPNNFILIAWVFLVGAAVLLAVVITVLVYVFRASQIPKTKSKA